MRTIAKIQNRNPVHFPGGFPGNGTILPMTRFFSVCLFLAVLFFHTSCFLSRPQISPEPPERVNLHVLYSSGPEEGPGERVELWVQPSGQGVSQVFYRSSPGKKPWLPVWDAAYLASLSQKKVERFLRRLDLLDFFSLPPVLEVSDAGKGEAILLRVQVGSRLHQVVARGKVLPSLTECLEALQSLSGVRLLLPKWYPALNRGERDLVGLVRDPERSLALHKKWLKGKALQAGRLLDLFALEVKTGRRREAEKILDQIQRQASAAGLLPALKALLK